MKNIFIALLATLSLLLCNVALHAQNEIENTRIDLNVGYPTLYTVGLEYVFSFLGDRFALNADIGYLPLGEVENDFELEVLDWSANIRFYFFGEGEGLNVTAGFFQANLFATDTDYVGENGTAQKAEGTVTLNYARLMLGYRWVWGHFTLSFNGGYGFILNKNADMEVTYAGYTNTESYEIDEIPKAMRNPIFVTIGFGFAF